MAAGTSVPAVPARIRSIGARSRPLKRRHRLRNLARATAAVAAIWVAAVIVGFAVAPLGVGGITATFALMLAAFVVLNVYPRMRAPIPATLRASELKTLAGRTEVYLEAQRPLLPPPAQGLLDRLGTELDQLAPQLATLGEGDPAAHNVRTLLGEHLPGLIESYTRIPTALRGAENAGATPERQLTDGLEVIAREVATMTGQIARGELDALATRGRYLETRYQDEPV